MAVIVDLSGVNAPTIGIFPRLRMIGRAFFRRDAAERIAARDFESDQRAGMTERRASDLARYNEAAGVHMFHKLQAAYRGEGRKTEPARQAINRMLMLQLLETDKSIAVVVDFSSYYGWLGHEIARRCPHIRVMSTSRHEAVAALNRAEFPLPNLDFLAVPDMAAFIRSSPERFANSIFIHTDTAMRLLMPNALRAIYLELFRAGTAYVIAHEQTGFSRYSLRQFQFSYQPRASMWHRDGLLLHNFPEMLESAGFTVIQASAHRVPGVAPDWRSAVFTAMRGGLDRQPHDHAAAPSSTNGRWISHSARPADGVPSADAKRACLMRSPATTASST
jgi:hypothetical protein